jgi:hypothetical protein
VQDKTGKVRLKVKVKSKNDKVVAKDYLELDHLDVV